MFGARESAILCPELPFSLTTPVATTAGPANDVHALSSTTRTWTELTGALEGSRPAPRSKMGFANAKAGKIYLFGGIGTVGPCNSQTFCWFSARYKICELSRAKVVPWCAALVLDPAFFVAQEWQERHLWMTSGSSTFRTSNGVHILVSACRKTSRCWAR